MEQRKRVVIDTDIGDDVDDALAIAMAIKSRKLQVAGITTMGKYASNRAVLAQKVLEVCDAAFIPVYAGIETPIVKHMEENEDELPCLCGKLESDYVKSEMHAVNFLVQTLQENPDTTILALGPLMNLAAAALIAPEVMKGTNIVIMGGAFESHYQEWNIYSDPEAAAIVLRSGANIKMVGLDVTTKCILEESDLKRLRESPGEDTRYLSSLIETYRHITGNGIMLHDPLVIGEMLDSELLKYSAVRAEVELRGEFTRGSLIVEKNYFGEEEKIPNIEAAVEVDRKAFTELFMDIICDEYSIA